MMPAGNGCGLPARSAVKSVSLNKRGMRSVIDETDRHSTGGGHADVFSSACLAFQEGAAQ
jgi:hypothetical protein